MAVLQSEIDTVRTYLSEAMAEKGQSFFKRLMYDASCKDDELLAMKIALTNKALANWNQHPDGSFDSTINALTEAQFQLLYNQAKNYLYLTS